METIKPDYKVILDIVDENSTILDLGCGNGALLDLLIQKKKVKGHGIEIDEKAIYECVERGLASFTGIWIPGWWITRKSHLITSF